jgi:glycine hydroxymethyltransferase
LEHVIAAKAVAFHEALQPSFRDYAEQVIRNAQAMAKAFVEKGYRIVSGGTDNHLLLIDLRSKGVTGKQAEDVLSKVDITVNKNMVPFDTESPLVTSGIRVGTAAVTTRGMDEAACRKIADWMDTVIREGQDVDVTNDIRQEINRFMQQYPLYEQAAPSLVS